MPSRTVIIRGNSDHYVGLILNYIHSYEVMIPTRQFSTRTLKKYTFGTDSYVTVRPKRYYFMITLKFGELRNGMEMERKIRVLELIIW